MGMTREEHGSMNTGVAVAIFRQINSDKYSDKQKENAIRRVLDLKKHCAGA